MCYVEKGVLPFVFITEENLWIPRNLIKFSAEWWWHTPFILALGKKTQAGFCEIETSLVFRASSRTGSKDTGKPCLEKPKNKNKKIKFW